MRAYCHCFVIATTALVAASLAVGQPPDKAGKPAQGKGKGKQTAAATEQQLLADVRGAADFNVTIYAKPPDANYPTCLWPMPTGEVFIGSDQQGSLGKTPGMGRVIRAIDTKGT